MTILFSILWGLFSGFSAGYFFYVLNHPRMRFVDSLIGYEMWSLDMILGIEEDTEEANEK